ncbi:unnamed protein product [Paramecium primaurelia]|uniref:Uncharacterized protein n=1 Tax=Paramecium primaurelia TaxID=5886 RepID=A0A8S1Q2E2_PARPR|nr:unnamed protein product [Paramecium primaurelia]
MVHKCFSYEKKQIKDICIISKQQQQLFCKKFIMLSTKSIHICFGQPKQIQNRIQFPSFRQNHNNQQQFKVRRMD